MSKMTKSSLWSVWSVLMITLLINFILLIFFWVITANAQYLFPTQPDPLFLYGIQTFTSPISQFAIGMPQQVPLNDILAFEAFNSGFYPNATYFGAPVPTSIPKGQYLTNTTGYYSIESSSSCTCNLP